MGKRAIERDSRRADNRWGFEQLGWAGDMSESGCAGGQCTSLALHEDRAQDGTVACEPKLAQLRMLDLSLGVAVLADHDGGNRGAQRARDLRACGQALVELSSAPDEAGGLLIGLHMRNAMDRLLDHNPRRETHVPNELMLVEGVRLK